jgi:hypothetical protein
MADRAGTAVQRRLQRPPARIREAGKYLPQHPAEQVVQRREGEWHLGAGRAAGQHAVAARGGLHRVLPHRRLADPDIAHDDQGRWRASGRREEGADLGDLGVPPDQARILGLAMRYRQPGRHSVSSSASRGRGLAPHPTETSAQGQIHRRLTF